MVNPYHIPHGAQGRRDALSQRKMMLEELLEEISLHELDSVSAILGAIHSGIDEIETLENE